MWFKRIFSYFFELTLEVTKSTFNPYLEVSLSRGRVKLNTRTATYSFEDRYTAFVRVFDRLALDPKIAYRILVLGYGLGSIPLIVKKNCRVNAPLPG